MRSNPVPELKRQLSDELIRAIGPRRRWDVASILGVHASRVSDLRHGKVERFTLETLIRFAALLGRRVSIVIASDRERRGPVAS